jgi:hypothetical protein
MHTGTDKRTGWMSRIWTVITLNDKTGATESVQFDGSFDCHLAREQFAMDNPMCPIIALMPGKIEVTTYPVIKPHEVHKVTTPAPPDDLDDHF